jgi:hypothetical protein
MLLQENKAVLKRKKGMNDSISVHCTTQYFIAILCPPFRLYVCISEHVFGRRSADIRNSIVGEEGRGGEGGEGYLGPGI